ncbi:class I SAM-dependent RNA methyltransferase [Paracoccus suum]|uniref:Class I SAM-dependent RNA methyltransferase n=1 Tax=Paracoccus suum TaxID=2259340 RepID=A0A344PGM5_9RHOB|nr:class I SAM-dependent RNA methyltransferase [Paracoccus suum]AXC48530.1 class I SAM-dependent RNA methyltransferase [Paracoccus suum]
MNQWQVERLGRRGDGVAHALDGSGARALAGLTLPGEVIAGTPVDGRIAQPAIVTPSPDRVAAPCPHYRACGGCTLMHARDDFVADWKVGIVTGALAAQGIAATVAAQHASPPRSRRRAVLAGRRTKRGALVGLHARASDVIVDLHECLVVTPAILAALPLLRELTVAGASRAGTLDLTVIDGPEGLDVSVTGGKPADAALTSDLARLAEAGNLARLTWDGESLTRRRPWIAIGPARVVPPPGGFLQATAEGQAALTAAVLAGTAGARRVVDLFAGCGTFSLPLAQTAEVVAIEGLAPPLDALQAAWRAMPGLRQLSVESRDLARRPMTAAELAGFDAIVIDPPRAGATPQAAQIAASDVPQVVWISCDPVTFARDARVMVAGGYELARLEVVDQFLWSPHVETSAVFRRAPGHART